MRDKLSLRSTLSKPSTAWRRTSAGPRIILTLFTVWLAAFYLKPPVYHVLELSKLGQDVKPGNRFGLSPQKLAIIYEPRHMPHLAALLLHTVSVLPSDWPVLYIGSYASVVTVNTSYGIQMAQARGRLWMQEAPDWIDFEDRDQLAAIISMPEFYKALPRSVEWLYMAGTDSVLCSSSLITMDEWLHYDFVGSPWSSNSWHDGSNGVSLRRVSKVKRALDTARREKGLTISDDTHLMEALYMHPQAVVPSESTSALFVMEGLWVERPMAYHPSPSFLKHDEGWVRASHRHGIWEHCPELKTIMQMKLSREKCPDPPPSAAPAVAPPPPPPAAPLEAPSNKEDGSSSSSPSSPRLSSPRLSSPRLSPSRISPPGSSFDSTADYYSKDFPEEHLKKHRKEPSKEHTKDPSEKQTKDHSKEPSKESEKGPAKPSPDTPPPVDKKTESAHALLDDAVDLSALKPAGS